MSARKVSIGGKEYIDGGYIDLDKEDVRLADGSRLTEARAQLIAEEVLQVTGRGRPSLTAPGRRSPQLRLAVPEQLRDELHSRAAAEHRTVSDVAREALEQYLAS